MTPPPTPSGPPGAHAHRLGKLHSLLPQMLQLAAPPKSKEGGGKRRPRPQPWQEVRRAAAASRSHRPGSPPLTRPEGVLRRRPPPRSHTHGEKRLLFALAQRPTLAPALGRARQGRRLGTTPSSAQCDGAGESAIFASVAPWNSSRSGGGGPAMARRTQHLSLPWIPTFLPCCQPLPPPL